MKGGDNYPLAPLGKQFPHHSSENTTSSDWNQSRGGNSPFCFHAKRNSRHSRRGALTYAYKAAIAHGEQFNCEFSSLDLATLGVMKCFFAGGFSFSFFFLFFFPNRQFA